MGKGAGARWILAGTIGLLAFVGVGASAAHYLQEPYNPGFLDFPTIVALHVVLGGVYVALAPFQFVGRIRSRHLGYHRWAGRLLVSVGLVVGATALFMGLVIPKGGWPERAVIGLFGIVFLFALIKGFLHVRARRVALHREWMIRALAIGLAIATARRSSVISRFRPLEHNPAARAHQGEKKGQNCRGEVGELVTLRRGREYHEANWLWATPRV
jgi:hypothetical protein